MLWNLITFTELFKHSPREAFEYRLNTLGDPIPDEWLTEEEKQAKSVAETPSVSVNDYKSLLKWAGISFFAWAKEETLKKLCIDNNLL